MDIYIYIWGVAIYGRDPAQDCGGIFYGGATGRGGGTHGHSNNILAATFEIEVLKTYKIEKALRKEPLKGNLRPPKTDFQDPFFSFFRRASVGVLKIAKNTVKPTKTHIFAQKPVLQLDQRRSRRDQRRSLRRRLLEPPKMFP